jgi:YD repeat-containing protein
VEFDATASHDPDGEIVRYEWDWDGAANGWDWLDSGTNGLQQHEFVSAGTFSATVRVFDDHGDAALASVQIQATDPYNNPPVAVLTIDPSSGEKPLTVNFDASDSHDPDGTIVNYEWDLDGDGAFSEAGEESNALGGSTATFTYTESGEYLAAMRVTDDELAQSTATESISITGIGEWILVEQPEVYANMTSIAIINGTPAIAFTDFTMSAVYQYYTKSSTATGLNAADWSEPVLVDMESDSVIEHRCTLLEIDGNPAVCYSISGGETAVRYARATTSSGTTESDWSQKVGIYEYATSHTALLIVDGNPAICIGGGWDLYYTRSTTPTGSGSEDWLEPFVILDGG